jgi:hypothetical protein
MANYPKIFDTKEQKAGKVREYLIKLKGLKSVFNE